MRRSPASALEDSLGLGHVDAAGALVADPAHLERRPGEVGERAGCR